MNEPEPTQEELERQLAQTYGGYWGEHPRLPTKDWKYEVANDDTRQGYWDWVLSKMDYLKP